MFVTEKDLVDRVVVIFDLDRLRWIDFWLENDDIAAPVEYWDEM